MRKYDAALFDVDGTVLDTSAGIIKSVSETVDKFGLKKLSESELRTFIGPPIEWSFESKLGLTGDALTEAAAYFRERYSGFNLLDATPYEGIFELMECLKSRGVKIAIATYKKQDYALKLLKHFGFDNYAGWIYGSDYAGKLKKSDIIQLCLDDMNVTNSRALMIGDTKHDALGAFNLGVDFAGVSFGFGFGSGENIEDFKHVMYTDKAIKLAELFVDN